MTKPYDNKKQQHLHMKNYISTIIPLVILFFSCKSYSQSYYEGYISGNLPVWVELNIPNIDGLVTGTYFYKKNGVKINLTGEVKSNKISLTEKNKDGVITGVFNCTNYNDSITGIWNKPKNTKTVSVKMYLVIPEFKNVAIIPSSDKLMLASGNPLNKEISGSVNENGKNPKLQYIFAERGVLSTLYEWEASGAYSSMGTVFHNFNLYNQKEIILSHEIKPSELNSFKEKIKKIMREDLNKYKKDYSEEEWINVFGDKETYEKAFNVEDVSLETFNNFSISHRSIKIIISNYFGFPHVSQAMDFSSEINIPFNELKTFLNDNSIVRNL